jgi:hypothetical protein
MLAYISDTVAQPVILATQEAEIGTIKIGGQTMQKVWKNPNSTNGWAWWCMPVTQAMWEF